MVMRTLCGGRTRAAIGAGKECAGLSNEEYPMARSAAAFTVEMELQRQENGLRLLEKPI